METLTTQPDDIANPDCRDETLAHALGADPLHLAPPGGDLLRYGWASAALHAHPELHGPWARSRDAAIRRAVMRSPQLTADVAEAVVDVRRSGMHTLGNNPTAPRDLLAENPGAQRRRQAIESVVPGGVAELVSDPNRFELIDLGSGTIDLVLATNTDLTVDTAVALAERSNPAADPFVLAVLVERFGSPIWDVAGTHASTERLRAIAALSPSAATLRQPETAA